MAKIPIKFLFHPSNMVNKSICKNGIGYAISKEVSGEKGNYLCGIMTGSEQDAHGDRMTSECVSDMLSQLQTKDIPLYVNHGKDFTDDIGLMAYGEILKNGDLYAEFKLFDNEEANKVWAQANGLTPYTKPKQFGFSIEGNIPNGKFEFANGSSGKKIIHKIDLDPGVSLVTRPAYTTSMATAITKAFEKSEKIIKENLLDKYLEEKQITSDYFDKKYTAESALNSVINEILASEKEQTEKEQILNQVFDEYKIKMLSIYSSIGYKLDEDGGVDSVTIDANPLSLAKSSIDNFSKILKEEKNMDENLKTVLSDVIASLQMLLQSDEQTPEVMNALKSIGAKLQKEEAPKEEAPKEEAPKEEDKIEDSIMKALKKIFKQDEPKKVDEETSKEILKALKSFNSRIDGVEKGFDSLLSGFMPTETKVSKGLNSNLGQDEALTKLAELIGNKIQKSENSDSFNGSILRKNKEEIGRYFGIGQ